MVLPVHVPEWAQSIAKAGKLLAQLPSTPIGELAPRLLLSVPTGQYVSWMLANGALQADPKLGQDPIIGDRVTVWLEKKMQDVEVCARGDIEWELRDGTSRKEGKIGVNRVPGVVLPQETPRDRGFGQPTPEYRTQWSVMGANY